MRMMIQNVFAFFMVLRANFNKEKTQGAKGAPFLLRKRIYV
ncbi:MAG: hypothetical protein CNLJKLNK_00844 [Holosporales bacterium]